MLSVLSSCAWRLQFKLCLSRNSAETPGFPQAMLPSAFLQWEAVEGVDNGALAWRQHNQHQLLGCFDHGHLVLCCSELPLLTIACRGPGCADTPGPGGEGQWRLWL